MGCYLFLGMGNVNECGYSEGYGYLFNVFVDVYIEDEFWFDVYKIFLKEVVVFFKSDVILI